MNHKESNLKITQANLMYNQELEIAKRYQLFSQENIVVNADIITLQELNELERLEVFERVDKIARELELEDNSLSIIGGDLNAFDDSREYRFLTGRDIGTENQGAYWIDAWSTAGTKDNYATCSPRDNYYARLTAQRSGLKEYMRIPDRRIDYILTRGWNHGKRGDILDFEMQDKYNVYSDHWTLNTTIQI